MKWSFWCFGAAVMVVAACSDTAAKPDANIDAALSCDSESCPTGCCMGGVCVDGDIGNACGTGGEECVNCGAGATCNFGRCVDDTCAQTCDGCCQNDGGCKPFVRSRNTNAACGRRGEACVACPADQICVDGGCVATACTQGCGLDNGTCEPGTSTNACGQDNSGPMGCDVCGEFACVPNIGDGADQHCYLPPLQTFDVLLRNATLPPKDDSDSAWDIAGGDPDPFVKISACNSAPFVDGWDPAGRDCKPSQTSPTRDDTLTPNWNELVIYSNISSLYLRYLRFTIFDEDVSNDDDVASCTLAFDHDGHDLTNARFELYRRARAGDIFELLCSSEERRDIAKLQVRIQPHR